MVRRGEWKAMQLVIFIDTEVKWLTFFPSCRKTCNLGLRFSRKKEEWDGDVRQYRLFFTVQYFGQNTWKNKGGNFK